MMKYTVTRFLKAGVAAFAVAMCFFAQVSTAAPVSNGFVVEKWIDRIQLNGVAVDTSGAYGNNVYFGDNNTGTIHRLDGQGLSTPFATIPGAISSLEFDPTGAFGGLLYASVVRSGSQPDKVYAIAPDGSSSLFFSGSTMLSKGMSFGRGGAFGSDLYMADGQAGNLVRIHSDGTSSTLSGGLGVRDGNDDLVLVEDGPFGGFIYLTSVQGTDEIQRIAPSGSAGIFTLAAGGKSIEIGSGVFGDYLYAGGPSSLSGADGAVIVRYDASGNMEVFAEGFLPTNDNPIRTLAIQNDTMWAINVDDALYRITPVPEPITGDLNFDGFVGLADLNIILGNWNLWVPPGDPRADVGGVGGTGPDGFVGIDDLNVVLGNWNAGTPPAAEASAVVPEPGSVVVLGVVTVMVFGIGRSRRPAA
jgi:hypothetical protein